MLSHFSHLQEELSGRGIMIDVAGPGQHVPVVECKILTMKERVRAHEISLPYVMTQLFLTICVLISESYIGRSQESSGALHRAQD